MFKLNFISNLLENKFKSKSQIKKYEINIDSLYEKKVKKELIEIEKKISQTNKELLDAQLLQIKLLFSSKKNWLNKLQQTIYQEPVKNSINWHLNHLHSLYKEKNRLQYQYQKLTGTYWLNYIKRLVIKIILGLIIFLLCAIFISGIMTLIYLLPIILIAYLILQSRK